jgi:hypothetical protein
LQDRSKVMDGKATKRLFRGAGSDISIAVRRVPWSAMAGIVLALAGGPSCGSSKLSSPTFDASTGVDGSTAVDASTAVDSSTDVDPGCAPAVLVGNTVLTTAVAGTGLESCSDGTLRRRDSMQCPWPATSPEPVCDHVYCTSDTDCPQSQSAYFPKGYCADALHLSGYCGCFTGCRQDTDCAPGSICVCGTVLGACVPAQCASNADCGAGFACVATAQGVTGGACNQTSNPDLPPITLFTCQRAADSCRGQADCADAGTGGIDAGNEIVRPACLFDGTRRACGSFCAYPP